MASVRIADENDIERDTIPLVRAVVERKGFHADALARLTVNRDDLNGVSGLTPGTDRVYVVEGGVDTFGGVLRSPGRSGPTPTLLVDSFAEYMRRAQPVSLGQEKVGADDSALVTECISATPELSAGTLQTVTAGETYIFSGVTQLRKAKTVAIAAGGELVFNADRTVDYLSQRGSDHTSTTLSPANGSFAEDTFKVDRDGIAGSVTHLKVYGVGQGSHQIEATVVPSADSTSYPNKVTYSHPTWTGGDPESWGQRTNKDLKNVSALQAWGLTLIDDLQDPEVRVQTVVKGTDVELGDRFHVEHPEEDVDEDLRAVEVVKVVSATGTRYEVVFSNHSVGRETPVEANHRDSERYRLAYEGDLVQLEKGPGRLPVDATHDYVVKVFYPDDVVAEVRAELHVAGLNYRAFSQGGASGGGSSETSSGGGSHSHSVDVTHPSHSHDVQAPKHSHINSESAKSTGSTDGHTHDYIDNHPGSSSTLSSASSETSTAALGTTSSETSDSASAHSHDVTIPNHTHSPNPGILDWDGVDQSPAHYPQNVKVVTPATGSGIDLGDEGTFQSGADDGTQAFEATLDLSGELTAGQWNTIQVQSDGLGHIDASFSADLFRQSL